ncbi:MAG: flagellar motor protein MotB [Oscillospiraceae bacterium]|nr:flagellar motor protein MotB [Oscillospiraceae bacterium]
MPKPKVEKDTSERWLLTYSDLMNLLLILFIILYTSSKLDAQKAAAMSESLQEGFATIEGAAAASANKSGNHGFNRLWRTPSCCSKRYCRK